MTAALAEAPAVAVQQALSATVVVRDLVRAVTWAKRAIATRPPMQVLTGVVLAGDRRGLTATGFDYET